MILYFIRGRGTLHKHFSLYPREGEKWIFEATNGSRFLKALWNSHVCLWKFPPRGKRWQRNSGSYSEVYLNPLLVKPDRYPLQISIVGNSRESTFRFNLASPGGSTLHRRSGGRVPKDVVTPSSSAIKNNNKSREDPCQWDENTKCWPNIKQTGELRFISIIKWALFLDGEGTGLNGTVRSRNPAVTDLTWPFRTITFVKGTSILVLID